MSFLLSATQTSNFDTFAVITAFVGAISIISIIIMLGFDLLSKNTPRKGYFAFAGIIHIVVIVLIIISSLNYESLINEGATTHINLPTWLGLVYIGIELLSLVSFVSIREIYVKRAIERQNSNTISK